jgi:hypothetical protein
LKLPRGDLPQLVLVHAFFDMHFLLTPNGIKDYGALEHTLMGGAILPFNAPF